MDLNGFKRHWKWLVFRLVVGLLAWGTVVYFTVLTPHYGIALFIGVPAALGFTCGLFTDTRTKGAWGRVVATFAIPTLTVACLCVTTAIEGLICLLMAAPLYAVGFAVVFGIGQAVRALGASKNARSILSVLGWITVLAWHHVEAAYDREPPLHKVVTEIAIAAPPSDVWEQVVAFPEIAPPTEWYFRAGIAYPTHATIHGEGVGAIRRCEFTTGTFEEPITYWEEPVRLAFDVTHNPPPLVELSPFHDVSPEHLHGHFESERGEFLLVAQEDGGTLLRGTTWYRHELWPNAYWRWWTDALIHRIHLRVLNHIRDVAAGADEAQMLARTNSR